MNLIYGKCIRIEDTVTTTVMNRLLSHLDQRAIEAMVLGHQGTNTGLCSPLKGQMIRDQQSKRISLENDWLMFETSFAPGEHSTLMIINMNLYTNQIRRDEVINNFLAFKEQLLLEDDPASSE